MHEGFLSMVCGHQFLPVAGSIQNPFQCVNQAHRLNGLSPILNLDHTIDDRGMQISCIQR